MRGMIEEERERGGRAKRSSLDLEAQTTSCFLDMTLSVLVFPSLYAIGFRLSPPTLADIFFCGAVLFS